MASVLPKKAVWALLTWLFSASFEAVAISPQEQPSNGSRLESFDITAEPTRADWQYFLRASERDRERLWSYHTNSGKSLGNWAWGWRLGWVRACTYSHASFCGGILRSALFDRALVVRAEAATRLGRRFENSQNARLVELLSKAYGNKENFRRGKPLFVQKRILFALWQVGGTAAREEGARLASVHPDCERYWTLLSRS